MSQESSAVHSGPSGAFRAQQRSSVRAASQPPMTPPTARCPLSESVSGLPASRFDSELTQALEEADSEREHKDKVSQENAALGAEIYTLRRSLQVRTVLIH